MEIRKVTAIAFTYIGAVVGAGFSSGREIWLFFARHKYCGFWGIIIVGVFFIILAPIIFCLGRYLNIDSYHSFYYDYFPRWGAYFFDIIYSLFFIGSTGIMLAGGGSVFQDILNIPYIWGIFITLIIISITLLLKKDGIYFLNSIIIPTLLLFTILIAAAHIYRCFYEQDYYNLLESIKAYNCGWFRDSILYGAYNLSAASAVMIGIVCNEKENNIVAGTALGGCILFVLCIMLYLVLITAFNDTPLVEVPLLVVAKSLGKSYYILYVFILYFAMLTTAVSNLYCFNKRFSLLLQINYDYALVLSIMIIIPLSFIGFSDLVDYLYPLFGYLGIIIIAFYLYIFWREVFLINKK